MAELRILQINETCTSCGACASICPKKCITIKRNEEGFYFPIVDDEKCIGCKLCERSCHILSGEDNCSVSEDNFYMFADNDSVRLQSSSGGAFFRLAQKTISEGGIVFGSAYNSDNARLEIVSTDEEDICLIQKSKYIESYAGTTFSRVSHELKNNRTVLFCGTPCQVRGLKHYLSANKICDTNLITVDFICHGVPSSLCFDEYIKRFQSNKKKIVNIDFRNKRFDKNGQKWHDLSLRIDYNDNSTIVIPYEPPYYLDYYKLFEDSAILRKCCFKCNYPQHSAADFTMADFWGIYKYRPSIDDNKGISILKMHTIKAKQYWDGINHEAHLFEVLPFEAVKYIYTKKDKTEQRKKRDVFFEILKKNGFKRAVNHHYGLKYLLKAYTFGYIKTRIKMIKRKY